MSLIPVIAQPQSLFRPVFTLYAGKSNSYSGTGQTWANTTSAPADGSSKTDYDFYLGTSSSGSSNDPTFNGTAGNNSSSEYFSFDGADCFTLAGSNTTFINSLHKNNATFTFASLISIPTTANGYIFGDTSATSPGIALYRDTSGDIRFYQMNGSTTQTVATDSGRLPSSSNAFVALSYTESTGAGIIYCHTGTKSAYTFTQAYSSPTSTDASPYMAIGAKAPADSELPSGSKIWFAGMWNTALSESQLDTIFARTRNIAGI
jgi:hypothetical protein